MNITSRLALAFVSAALILTSCEKSGKKTLSSLTDLEGAKIASQTGAVFARFIDPVISNVEHKNFNSLPDIAKALSTGKVDAASLDMPVAKYFVVQNPDFAIFPQTVAYDLYGYAVAKDSELGIKANEVLQRLKENATLRKLEDIWFSTDESKKILPTPDYKEDFNGNAGTIKFGCESTMVPMSYIGADGQLIGFDPALASMIAYEMNMNVEFVPMTFDTLLPALASGKVNMVGSAMSITEERLKSVDFVGPYFEGGIVLVVKKDRLKR